jgi:hypothetical protein
LHSLDVSAIFIHYALQFQLVHSLLEIGYDLDLGRTPLPARRPLWDGVVVFVSHSLLALPCAALLLEQLYPVCVEVPARGAHWIPPGVQQAASCHVEGRRRQEDARFHQVAVAGERQHARLVPDGRVRVVLEAVPVGHGLLPVWLVPHGASLERRHVSAAVAADQDGAVRAAAKVELVVPVAIAHGAFPEERRV